MLYKNFSKEEKIWKLPVRMGLDILSAIKNLAAQDVSFFKGVLKAHVAFIQWIFGDKKQNIFPVKKTVSLYGLYKGSVVWQYFIKKKRTFGEIVFKSE